MGMNEIGLILLVFTAVTLAIYGLSTAIAGAGTRRLRVRLSAMADVDETEAAVSIIRARYLRQLSPIERMLEELPGVQLMSRITEQAGWTMPAYRVSMLILGLAVAGVLVTLVLTQMVIVAVLAGALLAVLPIVKARRDRARRLEAFESQLPDALDLMSRSLRAGNPLMESFKFVADEMTPPISTEFSRGWSNVNYGVSLKASLADMIERTPSVSLRSLATAILVQRETGGNLAEILDKITGVLRQRARFQRRLRTLTAEGRMSAWVLAAVPFVMAGIQNLINPGFMNVMFEEPAGRKIMMGVLALMVVGLVWISRIVKVRV
jgi:tight adherence protein B